MKKRLLLFLVLIAVLFTAFSVAVFAASEAADITGIELQYSTPVQLDLSEGSITVTGDEASTCFQQNGTEYYSTAGCVVRQSSNGTATENTIVIKSGCAKVSISDLNISSAAPSISIEDSATLNLSLIGKSILVSEKAGIFVSPKATLDISGNGELSVSGGHESAGIGGCNRNDSGHITISSGTVIAKGGYGSAGIGASEYASFDEIVINGGNVSAYGGWFGAAIGTSYGYYQKRNNEKIIINGGTVYAKGYDSAGIGGGYCNEFKAIEINGGTITAIGDGGAAIGTGLNSGAGREDAVENRSISINHATVSATAKGNSSAIGGGGGYSGFSGGTVIIHNSDITAVGYFAVGGGGNERGIDNDLGCEKIVINNSTMNVTHTHTDPSNADYQEKIQLGTNPTAAAALKGNGAIMSVSASAASSLYYQWQELNGEAYTDYPNAANATAHILISDDNNGRAYRCKITNAYGNVIYSDSARAYVLAFSKQPESIHVNLENLASLHVESTCANVTYQWQRSYDNGQNWNNLVGEIYPTLLVNATLAENSALYRCMITASNGDSLASDSAQITVNSTVTTYTVNYYQESPDGKEYVLVDKIVIPADAGTRVTAGEKSYDFFSENASLGVISGIVKSDSTLMLSRYYDRNTYTLSFDMAGGTAEADIVLKYGADIALPDSPTKLGYRFTGWYLDQDCQQKFTYSTMPGKDITAFAKWTLIGEGRGIEYAITGIKLRDTSYREISSIPAGRFFVEVSVKNISSQTMDTLVLAIYDKDGRFLGMQYLYVNPPIGYSFTLGAELNNEKGQIGIIKAFMLPALGGLVPLAEAVEFRG